MKSVAFVLPMLTRAFNAQPYSNFSLQNYIFEWKYTNKHTNINSVLLKQTLNTVTFSILNS